MNQSSQLPAAEKTHLSLGFLKLTDSAPLVMAKELGFFDQYGLDVTLQREVSWANIRDKLVAGLFDAASLLAPLPFMTTLGLSGLREPLITGLVLSLNGNAVTLSSQLYNKLDGVSSDDDPTQIAQALGRYVRDGGCPLTLASVHSFSCHTLLLQRWLALGGLQFSDVVRKVILPPEQMADSLAQGIIDGYCVGAPWNTVSVSRGTGVVVSTGYDIWNNAPEKVLGVAECWHQAHPGTHLRLRLALMETCEWLSTYENRVRAAQTLSRPEYLDLPMALLRPSLTGNFVFARGQEPAQEPHFHVFHRYHAGFPWHSDAACLLSQELGLMPATGAQVNSDDIVPQVFRTDLYREAARGLGWTAPSMDSRPFGAHDQPWEIEPGIELGADRMLLPAQD